MGKLAVMMVVCLIGVKFVALDVHIIGDKVSASYLLDRANKHVQICVNLLPQSLYYWDSGDPINLNRLDYAKFGKSGELVFEVSLTLRNRQGMIVNYAAGYQLNDTPAVFINRSEYLGFFTGSITNRSAQSDPGS
jgi:hypothetical protein